jgi:hypothetical protein
MAVHHIHVDHSAAAALCGCNLFRQMGEIGRKDGWN